MRETSPYPLTTQCACMDDEGRIWMVSNMVNGLFCLDPDTGKTEYVTSFEREPLFCGSLYTKAFWYKGKVICIPCLAKNIAFYDTVTGEIRYLPIRSEEYLVYFNAVSFAEEKVLLFPVIYSHFAYILDLNTEHYKTIQLEYGNMCKKIEDMYVIGEGTYQEKAYFVIQGTDLFFSIDLNTYKIVFHQTNDHQPLFNMSTDGQYLYLFHGDGCGYDVYKDDDCISVRQLYPKEKTGDRVVPRKQLKYFSSSCVEDLVINMPMHDQPIYVFWNGSMQKIMLDWKQIKMTGAKIQAFSICLKRNRKLILLPYHSSTMVVADLFEQKVQYFNISICGDVLCLFMQRLAKQLPGSKQALMEPSCPLTIYLDALRESGQKKTSEKASEQNRGRLIYHILWNNSGDRK